jgi:hypothetical protein
VSVGCQHREPPLRLSAGEVVDSRDLARQRLHLPGSCGGARHDTESVLGEGVFGSGIRALATGSGVLLIAVGGNTLTLIPLFAIGVFTGFTLSQTGLVVPAADQAGRLAPPGGHQTASAPW